MFVQKKSLVRQSTAVLALSALAGSSFAGGGPTTFDVTIDETQSSVAVVTTLGIPIDGTFIGNYDAATNPGGTRTLPGLFGGSGNNPIDMMMTLNSTLEDSSAPTGTFTIAVDEGAGTVEISGFTVDVLGGAPLDISLGADILYDTFRTVNPSSTFLGGITLPLPLGTGSITMFDIVQSGPGVGTLVPTGQPNEYTVVAAVPSMMHVTVEALGQSMVQPPTPVAVPITGTLTLSPGHVDIEFLFENINSTTTPAAPGAIVDAPLDVPTILPPGNIAHLLMNADVLEGQIDSTLDVTILASGDAAGCYADCDGSGTLNILDFICFGDAFAAGDPYADCDASTTLNILDFICYGDAFAAGCP